jgi:hypothetical protein
VGRPGLEPGAAAVAVLRDGEHAPSARAERNHSPDARSLPKLGAALQACLRGGLAGVPSMRWGDADHRVHHRPRCRGRDSEAPREGRDAVPSRPTGYSSRLRRFLSLMSAAACAGCVRDGGSGSWGRGSRGAMLGHAPLAAGSRRFRGRLDAREPAMGPKQVPNTVFAGSRTKGTSYPSPSRPLFILVDAFSRSS